MSDFSYQTFNNDWFLKNQKILICLLNSKSIKNVTRNLFRVNRFIDKSITIYKISPNSIHIIPDNSKPTVIKAFLHHEMIYSKVVYENFKYLWQLVHWWDMKIANKLSKSLNFGFDDLESGNGIVSSGVAARGYVSPIDLSYVETWNDKRYGEGEHVANYPVVDEMIVAMKIHSKSIYPQRWFAYISRGITVIDTMSIGSGASITNAVVTPLIRGPFSNSFDEIPGNPSLCLTSHNKTTYAYIGDNSIDTDDYNLALFGTEAFAEITMAERQALSGLIKWDFVLNSQGRLHINKGGFTVFGWMLDCDLLDIEPDFLSRAYSAYNIGWDEISSIEVEYVNYQIVMNM